MHAEDQWYRVTRMAASRAGRPFATWRGRWLAAFALLLSVALVVGGCASSADPSPTTVRVALGSVARTVSATGTLQAITEQRLGFSKSGKLVDLTVTVGQQVNAGQVLARIDDFDAKADLQQAKAKLDQQQARLDRIRDGNRADAADDDHQRAKSVLDATKDESDAIDDANAEAVEQAQKQLDADQDNLKNAQAESDADQTRCNRSVTGGSGRYDGYSDYGDVKTRDERGLLVESPLDAHSPSCERAGRGKSSATSYQRRIEEDKAALEQAKQKESIDHAKQRVAVENARREATAAGNEADGLASERPHDLDEQAAAVADAAADVRRAEQAVADTTLLAPVAGKVASINGTVGEYLGVAAGTTPLAPGGRASLPDMDSGTGAKDSTGSKAERPGGPAFILLKDVNSFQVVAPYEESDAAQVQANQKVALNFDAIPGLTLAGTVTSIAPAGTQIQDVTNYYVSVVLNQLDPRLKGGLTAETKVVVGGVDNVLVVPTAAIQRGGDAGVVQVLQSDGTTRQVQVQLGLVGDSTTEILAGLIEGQQVVVAQG